MQEARKAHTFATESQRAATKPHARPKRDHRHPAQAAPHLDVLAEDCKASCSSDAVVTTLVAFTLVLLFDPESWH
jgi:hypothetical protein